MWPGVGEVVVSVDFLYTGFPFSHQGPASALLIFAASLVSVAALPGCEKEKPPAPSAPAETEDAASPLASVLGDAPPLPPSGSWKGEIESFTTEEKCVQDLRVASPLLGDALLALGYETLAQDACGLLAASKEHEPKRCAKILATSLRSKCVTLVAATTADPDACPYLESRERSRGRDATCLALASGREALCAGESSPADERACRAVYAEDPTRCAPLLPEPRARCVREVERWRGLLPRRPTGPANEITRGKLVVRGGEDGGADLIVDLRDAARGVVVSRNADSAVVVFGDRRYAAPTTYVPPPTGAPRVGFETNLSGKLQRLELEIPGRGVVVFPGAPFDGTVSVAALKSGDVGSDMKPSDLRGHPVQIALVGNFGAARVELHVDTFVRDVVRAGSGPALP